MRSGVDDPAPLPSPELEAQAQAVADMYGRRRDLVPLTRLAPELEGVIQQAVPFGEGALAAWRVGEGPAVLLLHGFADSQRLWSPLMAELLRLGRPFVVCDMPGFGRSSDLPHVSDSHIEAIHAVTEALGPIDAIAAHSMNAAHALCAVAEGLPARRLVAFAIAPRFEPRFAHIGFRAPEGTPSEVITRAVQLVADRIAPDPRFDVAAAAARLRIPGLLIHSRDDEHWSSEASAYVASHWPGAELRLVDGLGHRNVARDPALVRLAAEFLAEQ